MNSRTMAAARRFFIALGIMLATAAVILGVATSATALADDGELAAAETPSLASGDNPVRTIMIYLDGASAEENGFACTDMLKEYMASKLIAVIFASSL